MGSTRRGYKDVLITTLEEIKTSIDGRTGDVVWRYSPEIGRRISTAIAEGMSVKDICKLDNAPTRWTIHQWIKKYPEFKAMYEEAKEIRAEADRDDVKDLILETNEENAKANRVKIDGTKWLAKIGKPSEYADVSPANNDGQGGGINIIVHTGIDRTPVKIESTDTKTIEITPETKEPDETTG